jgi:hypothetical protein
MKFVVEYDERGTIKTIGAVSSKHIEGEPRMELEPRAGHKVVTVEVPEITDANDHEHIIGIKRNYRIEEHQGQHRLVKNKS